MQFSDLQINLDKSLVLPPHYSRESSKRCQEGLPSTDCHLSFKVADFRKKYPCFFSHRNRSHRPVK